MPLPGGLGRMDFICFDTEDNSPELMAAGKSGFDKRVTQISARCSDGTRYHSSGDVDGFLRWLKTRKERRFYAHNLQYDLGNLFGNDLDVLDVTMVGGRMIKAVWGTKIFVDTFNVWPMSVKALGEDFGMLKGKMDVHSKEYVDRDVEIIFEAMDLAASFCKKVGIKEVPTTLGGLCVKVWKEMGGSNVHDCSELSRKALFGGRVELFKVKNETPNVAYTDINSLYPSVMGGDFPGMLEDCGTDLPKHGVADVTVKIPKTDLAVLPWRSKEGKIYYGWGKFRGVWTMPEIRAALERGGKIERVHEARGTDESFRCYREFTLAMYQERREAKTDAEKLLFKLLMNNLYGRLGTSGEIGRSVYRTDRTEAEGVPYGEKVLVTYQMPLSEETNWCHAAYVTAYGRLELLKYLEKIGTGDLIYCDTDSTIFDSATRTVPFPTGKALGEMKIEDQCTACGEKAHSREDKCAMFGKGVEIGKSDWWGNCETYAPKMYRTGATYKAKGVPKKMAEQFVLTGRAAFELPFKFREAVRFFDRKNARKLSVWRTVEKSRVSSYDKKILKGNRYFPCDLTGKE